MKALPSQRFRGPWLALLAAWMCAQCEAPNQRCARDADCNAGRVCVLGVCQPARHGTATPEGPDSTAPEGDAGLEPKTEDAGLDRGTSPPPDDVRPSADQASPDSALARDLPLRVDAPCGASEGGCGWTPASLPGLVLWLDAGAGVTTSAGGRVERWRDHSGRGNDAVQPEAGARPVLVPDRARGLPMVVFGPALGGAIHLKIRDVPSLRWGTDDFAVFVIGSSTNRTSDGGGLMYRKMSLPDAVGVQLWGEGRGDGRFMAELRWPDAVYLTSDVSLADGGLVSFGMKRTGRDRIELRINGRVSGRAIAPIVDVSAVGFDCLLGAAADQGFGQLHGGVAEVVAVHGELPAAALAALDSYFRDKYELP